MDTQNNVITDEAILRKIKRTDSYKELRANLMSQLKNEIEAETKKIVEIYKLSSQVSSYSDYKKILDVYKRQSLHWIFMIRRSSIGRTILPSESTGRTIPGDFIRTPLTRNSISIIAFFVDMVNQKTSKFGSF